MALPEGPGPLAGLRIIEFAGIGPGPFAAMLLADLGADTIRIERAGGGDWPDVPVVNRNRASLTLDLKREDHRAYCLAMAEAADILIEGFRPGVMEKLGLGPEQVHACAPRLIYGRMTGWGQEGPLADRAGHDINYIGLAGALALLPTGGGHSVPPLNLLGDYAGGGLYLALGILAALVERGRSGKCQVVDAAIVDGTASLLAPVLGMLSAGFVDADGDRNLLGGRAAPFYRTYACADGKEVAVGPLEARFLARMCELLGIDPAAIGSPADPAQWAAGHKLLAERFASQPRDHWAALFEGEDACVSPVLTPEEALNDPHLAARGTYQRIDGALHPAPAPRFSRTPAEIRWPGPAAAPSAAERLSAWGLPSPPQA
jgi:alpha-methylacyl-CoA racemase